MQDKKKKIIKVRDLKSKKDPKGGAPRSPSTTKPTTKPTFNFS